VRSALRGSLSDLKRDIESAEHAGKLDRANVIDLAHAVAARELTSAEGAPGAARVRRLRGCARPLGHAMEQRAQQDDEIAAELTLILVERRVVDGPALVQRYARSANGAWRAVAARAAERPIDTDLRRAFYVDPDQRVRRAALATARQVHDARELEPLLEAARVDPDPQSQSLAVAASGAIGGERAVLALKDLWASADDPLRIAIVDAWSDPASLATGGARELSIAAERGGGLAAVSASYAQAHAGGPEATVANARLRRFILDGTDDEKRLALRVVTLDPETEAALVRAAHEASPELQVIALGRLAVLPARRAEALSALRARVNETPSSPAAQSAHDAALRALADLGDHSISATLAAGLRAKSQQTRWDSARALASLDEYSRVAPGLADDDADLRSDLACTLLARENARR